ncbi:DHS-like NAD/FAD-binding domain-containing protein [Pluteus cervinus]|uniref:DHS-like NAD/FAD-binding domain-containing protein n=1 Tax=Pluteus cervinus TaxID=181527 RepID=A0ACD3AGY2_9AGAR|nr:DHS-like NAD/FAD-binding domain-containing protein [Pluteus cervinus]
MRISVPGVPQSILASNRSNVPKVSPEEAVYRLTQFLKNGQVTLLTGAGVSVDSGIRAYRGEDGRYMNPDYKPIFYHELVDDSAKGHAFRQRYWLRSYLGYPPVRDAEPNTTHFALAALQHTGFIPNLVTQNVDGLHHKALAKHTGRPSHHLQDHILELHGTLHRVRCKHGHAVDRDTFQTWLSAANPKWRQFADEMEKAGTQPRTNPDGDVAIEHLGISYSDFVVPECPTCSESDRKNSVHKPDLVFFGESIPDQVRDRSFREIENGQKLLVMGTTLATYSAFRLLKHALELKKPVMMLNVGPSRADGLNLEKIDIPSGVVMTDVAKSVVGATACEDPIIIKMLQDGIVKPPATKEDRTPRRAG